MRSSTGSSLVELALLLPLFSALVLSSAEIALLAYDSIEVSDAARAGAAYGSQSLTTASDIAGMQNFAASATAEVPGLTATASRFYSCSNTSSTQNTTPPTCTSGNRVLTYVQVRTSTSLTPPIHLPGLPSSFELSGIAIMRVQQ